VKWPRNSTSGFSHPPNGSAEVSNAYDYKDTLKLLGFKYEPDTRIWYMSEADLKHVLGDGLPQRTHVE